MPTARIVLPREVRKGAIFEIKTLITHEMETGHRRDGAGNPIPRNIINRFVATYGGEEIFSAELFPGVAANPYIAFWMRVPGPGDLELTWTDDGGKKVVEKLKLNVVG